MHAKNDQEMERAKFFKKIISGFYEFLIINIERFAGINLVIAVTETYFFTSSFILQIVNILVPFF